MTNSTHEIKQSSDDVTASILSAIQPTEISRTTAVTEPNETVKHTKMIETTITTVPGEPSLAVDHLAEAPLTSTTPLASLT